MGGWSLSGGKRKAPTGPNDNVKVAPKKGVGHLTRTCLLEKKRCLLKAGRSTVADRPRVCKVPGRSVRFPGGFGRFRGGPGVLCSALRANRSPVADRPRVCKVPGRFRRVCSVPGRFRTCPGGSRGDLPGYEKWLLDSVVLSVSLVGAG